MAITKGAKKAIRSSAKKRVFNETRKRAEKENRKGMLDLLSSGKITEAEQLLPKAYKAIDKAAKRGVIKKNTASRKKSRLVAAIQRAKK
ncbi:MAG: 30S ribosomal protein S20 [bacterium]|nr:30S ribosomal protein S20 [bacterium]